MNKRKSSKMLALYCLPSFIGSGSYTAAQDHFPITASSSATVISFGLIIALVGLSFIIWRRGLYFHKLYHDKSLIEKELRKFQMALEQSPSSVLITDNKGVIEFINSKYCEITGYSPEQLIGQNVNQIKNETVVKQVYSEILQHISEGAVWRGELSQRHRDGKHYHSSITIRPVLDSNKQLQHIYYLQEDISERINYKKNLFRQANYDELTGLPNRALANDRLTQAINNAERTRRSVMLMCIDLDRFKIVNDSLGHEQGDQLLIEAALRIKNCIREEDTIARLGGDEFLIILTTDASIANASTILQKVIDSIDHPFTVENRECNVTASIGVTVYPDDGQTAATLMRNADAAMYIAKELGRNTYHFYTPEMNEQAMQRLTMESELRHAIERDELELHYQPVIDAKTQRLVAVESLLRWNSEALGAIPPLDFIPLAEESGLIIPIGDWVLNQACRQLAEWRQQGLKDLRIAVNISSRQFTDDSVYKTVEKALKDYNLPGNCLELELTESLLMDSSNNAFNTMEKLKKLGVSLSLDDFGTGYSSLSYLKRFPFDVLKIDRSFVRDLHTDPENAALTSAVVAMAHSLGLKVVGEGVEEVTQQQYLEEKECDMLQGYLFSKPLAADKFPAWASQHSTH